MTIIIEPRASRDRALAPLKHAAKQNLWWWFQCKNEMQFISRSCTFQLKWLSPHFKMLFIIWRDLRYFWWTCAMYCQCDLFLFFFLLLSFFFHANCLVDVLHSEDAIDGQIDCTLVSVSPQHFIRIVIIRHWNWWLIAIYDPIYSI